jgi:hypothetical protein
MIDKIICPYCNLLYSKYGIKNHIAIKHLGDTSRVDHNKGKKYVNPSWNKGLTKEADDRIKTMGQNSGKTRNGQLKSNHSEETKQKISNVINEKIKNGTWHLSFSHARTHEYNGTKFHGTWEINYAKYLDANNIEWTRPAEQFNYIFESKERKYTPDFYLCAEQKYVEIKGYPTQKDFAKWDAFPLKLEILNGAHLQKINIIQTYKSRNIQYKNISWL